MCSVELSDGDLGDVVTPRLVETALRLGVLLAGREAPASGKASVQLAETLGRAIDVFEAALARLVERVDVSGAAGECGFASTGAWLRSRFGMREGRAGERVRLARQLPRLEQTATRFTGGDLPYGKATAICDAVARLDDDDAALGEDLLLDLVDAGHTAGELAKDGAHITNLIRQHRGQEDEPEHSRRGFRRSWLTVNRSLDGGSWIRGWLTPEHTATFNEIITPLTKPTTKTDDRDHAQRTADALFTVLSEGNNGAGVTVIIDLAAYTQATDRDAGSRHTGDVTATTAATTTTRHNGTRSRTDQGTDSALRLSALADRARPPARLLNGTEISPERARQIALNAGINALILGPSGTPLYLGRTVRLATPAQRKTLLALYDTCCVTHCRIPAHLSEIHHLDGGWKLGAPTDVDKLAPTCAFHNKWVEDHPDRVDQHTDAAGRTHLSLRQPWELSPSDNTDRIGRQRRPHPRQPRPGSYQALSG